MRTSPAGRTYWEQADDDKLIDLYNRRLSLVAIAQNLETEYGKVSARLTLLRSKGKIVKRAMSMAAQDQIEEQKTQTQQVVEALTPLVKDLNYFDPKPVIEKPIMGPVDDRSVEEAVLVLSDIHFGKRTETFNYHVMGERFTKLNYSVHRIVNLLRRGYKINKLNIFLIGDVVDGDMIYPGQAHGIEMPVIDQIYQLGIPMLRDFLLTMMKLFKKVEVHCIYGNHGRVNKYASRKTNFDYVLYKHLEAHFRNYKQIKFNVYDDWKAVVPVQGHNFLLTHGDAVSGGSTGLPLVGLIAALMRWATTIPEKFRYLVVGHFHTANIIHWTKDLTLITNGTFTSSDDFAMRVLKIESNPAQQFFGVNKKRGMTWIYTIDLADTNLPVGQTRKYKVLQEKANLNVVPHE